MAGTGGIGGGGSCPVSFEVFDGTGALESSAKGIDRHVGGNVTVEITFPDNTKTTVTLKGKERITFAWR